MSDEFIVSKQFFRVSDFYDFHRHGRLDLKPPFQRNSVWSPAAKSYLIDTMLRGFPVPLVFLQDSTDPKSLETKRIVVDGQQRLRTILGFIDPKCLQDPEPEDDFVILKAHDPQLAGKRFRDLPDPLRARIMSYEFSVNTLSAGTSDAIILQLFARLNSTGAKLTKQELRNAKFSGEFKSLAYRLAFRWVSKLLEWGVLTRQGVARMEEAELASDLMLLILRGVDRKTQASLDSAYKDYDTSFPHGEDIERCFDDVMRTLDAAVGTLLHRCPFRKSMWFYVLFAFVLQQLYPLRSAQPRHGGRRHALDVARLGALVKNREAAYARGLPSEVEKASRGAAADKASRLARLSFIASGW